MNRNEDYLDNLLTSVTNKLDQFDDDFEQSRESLRESYRTQNDLPQGTQSALDEIREDNFLKDFDADLGVGSEEDFIREFERELNGEAEAVYHEPEMDDFVDQMNELIGNGVEDVPFEVDTMTSAEPQEPPPFETDGADRVLDDGSDGMPETLFSEGAKAALSELEELQDETMDLSPLQGETADLSALPTEEAPVQPEIPSAPEGMKGLEDLFADTEEMLKNDPEGMPPMPGAESAAPAEEPLMPETMDTSLEDILGESDDEALSDIGRMLDADENGKTLEGADGGDPFAMGPDFVFQESQENDGESKKGKKKKEKNPNGFFAKLGRLLFGTPEELNPDAVAENGSLGEISEENMEIMAKEDAEAKKKEKQQQKELKKQQKKEAAEQKKKEKEAKKAEKEAKKAQKPKKEKPKKEKKKAPKEPPLPRVPVMMMWGIALSIMLFIFLGTALVGYSSNVSQAQEAFDEGDYVTAYTKLRGLKIRGADEELYNSALALAGIQTELDAYTALMEQKQYELALDALIRGIGRCQVHSSEAEEWGVSDKLSDLESQLNKFLREQFDISKRRAKKLYKIKKRQEYTLEVHSILEELGLYQPAGVMR